MTMKSSDTNPLQREKIMIKPSHRGLLHRNMGVPPGQPIPVVKLQARKKVAGAAEKKRVQFALNARK